MPLRRESSYADDFADGVDQDGEYAGSARHAGVRLNFSAGLLPKTVWGRVAAASGLILVIGSAVVGLLMTRSFLVRDEHFTVRGSSSIEIAGNSHLTRPQLLSVFGEDVERNIFAMPLDERRAELERLPWIDHATVMRLLPNRVRVAIVERTPVAFVRQGKEIGLVDANGVLLDMSGPADIEGTDDSNSTAVRKPARYSFPVLTGISATDPLSTRAARMKIYTGFVDALDAGGVKISLTLSEVDLSNPEDVKAILPDGASGSDLLVHFGEGKFLERYHQYQQHLAEWKTQYPKLASVDMRYERQVVLEMQPGSGVPTGAPVAPSATPAESTATAKTKPVAPKSASIKPALKPTGTASAAAHSTQPKMPLAATAKPPAAASAMPASGPVVSAPVKHLTTAFAVPSKPSGKLPPTPAANSTSTPGAPR